MQLYSSTDTATAWKNSDVSLHLPFEKKTIHFSVGITFWMAQKIEL